MIEYLLDLTVEQWRSCCASETDVAMLQAAVNVMTTDDLLDIVTERTIESLRGREIISLN